MSRDKSLDAGRFAGQHHSTADTRRVTYERLRSVGVSSERAKRDAETVARTVHDKLDKRG